MFSGSILGFTFIVIQSIGASPVSIYGSNSLRAWYGFESRMDLWFDGIIRLIATEEEIELDDLCPKKPAKVIEKPFQRQRNKSGSGTLLEEKH